MMKASKITHNLSDKMHYLSGENELQIIVELQPVTIGKRTPGQTTSRQERIRVMKDEFIQKAAIVYELLEKNGGKILNETWLSGSLHVRTPVSAISKLSDLQEVAVIDVPGHLVPDFGA